MTMRFKRISLIKSRWEQLLEREEDLRAIMTGKEELPPYPGDPGCAGSRLYRTVLAAILLFRGDFDGAYHLLQEVNDSPVTLLLPQLAAIWLDAETADPAKAWQDLADWQTLQEASTGHRCRISLLPQVFRLDRRLALRWAPALRYYLATLLNDWPPQVQAVAAASRVQAEANGVSAMLLVRIDYLLRFARARQERSAEMILAAVEDWRQLCRVSPEYGDGSEYMVEAAVALEYEERYDEALEWLERALQANPYQYDLLLVKGRVLKQLGDIKRGLAVCNQLIERYPGDFSGYCLRSNIYFMTGCYDKAMVDAHKACEVAPDNPNSFMARAFVLMQLGHYDKALADFEQTLRYDPERYDALRGQGKCLSMLGRDYDALASFNALRRVYPDDPDLYYELADVLFSAGYLDECEKVCQKCLQLDSQYVSAHVILGMIALRRNQDEKARQILTRAVAMEPDHPFALNELAYLNHLQGDDDTALELVSRALEESPDYADALANKGVIHYFRSEFEQSVAAYSQALQLVVDHVGAWVGKGNSLTQLCEFDEALQCFDSALALDPANAEACHGKAVLYRMLGLDDEVRKWQERAYMLDLEDDE
jgi:tetratricopeptide (TPR) repeat protein